MADLEPMTVKPGINLTKRPIEPAWSGSVWLVIIYLIWLKSPIASSIYCKYESKNFSFTVSNMATPSVPFKTYEL